MSHTPGPWSFDGPKHNIHVREAANPDMRICFMTSDGPTRANAHLIAAAPDMLTALQPFCDLDGEGTEDYPDDKAVIVSIGRHTNYELRLGDLRRARRILNAIQTHDSGEHEGCGKDSERDTAQVMGRISTSD